ncbi:C39 family peptidase [Candidatus Sumerlaeota bacterium]|nr:C39 family peptidase [Candidatus Sumerlaeota bacterium]
MIRQKYGVRFVFFLLILTFSLQSVFCGVDLPVKRMRQPDDQTCLPTCLTMALHFYGKVDLTKETVFALHKRTRYDRYNLPGIVKDYGLYALPCWYELGWNAQTLKKELDAGHPIITGCDQGKGGHFVLIIGYTDEGKWIIHDPTGKRWGYTLGGERLVADWEDINWRGGTFIHEKPFPEPKVSGIVTGRSIPDIMPPGGKAKIVFNLKNNGKKKWKGPLYLECIEYGFTRCVPRKCVFYDADSWLSPSRVMEVKTLVPDEETSLTFEIKVPMVEKPASFMEFWTILDSRGRQISDEAVSGPGLFDMPAKILVEPRVSWKLPYEEKAPGGKSSLPWHVKFGSLEADSASTMPGALKLFTSGKEYDTAWLGDSTWTDYKVEALVYCEYRPELKPKGWDRTGIFIRDNGDHAGNTTKIKEKGEYYCMIYDSDDGRIRAGYSRNGVMSDFHPEPFAYLKETGWRRFSISCRGDEILYELDGKPFHKANSRRRRSGSCGVTYVTSFSDFAMSRGVRFAQFKALP